jgi:hypothetical protein
VRLLFVPVLAALLCACTTQEIVVAHSVPLSTSVAGSYAEADLLDVGIVIFDAGVPQGEIDKQVLEELMREGTYVQIRRAESMYLAVELRETLQRSGHWGAVYVTPRDSNALDLTVHGEILRSDGNVFALRATATDATGRVWIDEEYDMETAASAYNRQRYPTQDPYQDVFNSVANDLAAVRATLDSEAIAGIRTVGELRYASELSPEAFGDYLEENRDGIYEPVRLPAADDPMIGRTMSVRQREQLFFETLDQHYKDFALEAAPSYDSWREYTREDSIRLEEAARAAKLRTTIGALAIALSIAYGTQNDADSLSDVIVQNAGIMIGDDLLRSAAVRRQEKRLHTQSLQEIAESFDDEAKTLVVEIQGTEHRLTGTADAQYEEWQGLLRQLFISETGFVPEDIEVYAEPAAAPPDAAGQIVDSSVADGATPTDIKAAAETGTVADEAGTGAGATTGADATGDGSAGGSAPAPANNTTAPNIVAPNSASDESGEAAADGRGGTPADV